MHVRRGDIVEGVEFVLLDGGVGVGGELEGVAGGQQIFEGGAGVRRCGGRRSRGPRGGGGAQGEKRQKGDTWKGTVRHDFTLGWFMLRGK